MPNSLLTIVRNCTVVVDADGRPTPTAIPSVTTTVENVTVKLCKFGRDQANFVATIAAPAAQQGGAPTTNDFFLGSANDLIRMYVTLTTWFSTIGIQGVPAATLLETTMRNLLVAYGTALVKASGVQA